MSEIFKIKQFIKEHKYYGMVSRIHETTGISRTNIYNQLQLDQRKTNITNDVLGESLTLIGEFDPSLYDEAEKLRKEILTPKEEVA